LKESNTMSQAPERQKLPDVDVLVLGAGLAGLTLTRHLLLHTKKTVVHLEKRDEIPSRRQKYGESSVQVAGYYYSRVLELEEYMYREQLIKYNLRFYWKSNGKPNETFEDFSQSYIRMMSNVASYQLNRNTFEGELLRRNQLVPERYDFHLSIADLEVQLSEDGGRHLVRWRVGEKAFECSARWVIDATGRGRFLAKKKELARESPVKHGAFFWWVEGQVDFEQLTDLSNKERRLHPRRQLTGHFPSWLATNHFCEEGLWFWVIPLQGKTSLGIVFDKEVINHHDVFTVEKATQWVSEHFPLFAADLAKRKVLDFSGLQSYAHDCVQCFYPQRWGLVGESGRFHDPLYSPGSDLISIHNTLLVDAIECEDDGELVQKCQLSENLARAVYQAYLPTFYQTYDCLGDQEAFGLKYSWELAIYFSFYVFPFINDFLTDRRFVLAFLRTFTRLGPINRSVQKLLSAFFHWKKANGLLGSSHPIYMDFMEVTTLAKAEKTFYKVGIGVDEAKRVMHEQLENLEEMARFVGCHVAAVMLDEPRIKASRAFAESLDLDQLETDPEAMRQRWEEHKDDERLMRWSLDPNVCDKFRPLHDPRWQETSRQLRDTMTPTMTMAMDLGYGLGIGMTRNDMRGEDGMPEAAMEMPRRSEMAEEKAG
jgi:flavin-dependent dehydrogenase